MSKEVAQVRRYLLDIPELLFEASHYLIPGSAPIDPTATRGTTIFRIPIAPTVLDLLDEKDKALDDILLNRSGGERRLGVLPTLGLWVALAYPELEDKGQRPRICCPARHHTVTGETDWLAQYASDIIELHPCCDRCERGKRDKPGCSCGCFVHDIELLWVELRQACRIRKQYVPKCPQCGHRIEGVYGSEEDEHPAWYRCTGCSKTWVKDAELRRLGATQPPMTLSQISSFLELPVALLHEWEREGRLSPVGRCRNVPLFEVEHVRAASKKVGLTTVDSQPGKTAAAQARVSWATLRYWEQRGWLESTGKDSAGRKLFSVKAVKFLAKSDSEVVA